MKTIESLSHWDGSYQKGGGVLLNTQSFTVQELVLLINVLTIKFNCKCSLHKSRQYYNIYISAKSIRKLIPELVPFFGIHQIINLLEGRGKLERHPNIKNVLIILGLSSN